MKKERTILISSAVVYILLYIFFYPKTYAIFDESCYIDLAYSLRQGTVYFDETNIYLHFPIKSGEHLVSKYPPGNSLLLMPLTFLGKRGIFLYGLIFHILGYLIFIKIIREHKMNTKYAIFYLFFPSYVLFSRTVMSDIPATVFFLMGFYCYKKENYLFTGMSFGLSFLIRYVNIILLPIFFCIMLFRKKRKGFNILLGFTPFLIIMLFYNKISYNSFLPLGYFVEGSSFSIRGIPINLAVYLLPLFLIYPLMIIFPVIYRGKSWLEILISCALFLFFYSIYSPGHILYTSPPLKALPKVLLLANRYFFPVIPLIFISYFSVCKRCIKYPYFQIILVFLILLTGSIHFYHNRYLKFQVEFREALYSHTDENSLIICNGEVTELVSEVWGRRNLVVFDKEDFSLSSYNYNKNIWLASLIKFDTHGATQIIALRDSLIARFDAELVEKIDGTDKGFKLYKVK